MADRLLRWYIDGQIGRTKSEVGGTYTLDADYKPLQVHMTTRVKGDENLTIDILDDGTTIFTDRPSLVSQTEHTWTTVDPDVMREGSIIKLDIYALTGDKAYRDLTVELELEKQ